MVQTETSHERILREHEELRASVAELEEYLELPRPELGSDEAHEWSQGLTRKLLVLHDYLASHFRMEEATGLMQDLARAHPRAARSIGELEKAHDPILDNLRAALDAAMVYGEDRAPSTSKLRTWVSAILENIRAHEEEETELVQRLVTEELGAVD
jgi:hypothetical protein